MNTPIQIQLHKKSKILEVHYNDDIFAFSAEYLRVLSPSAEVKGHGPNQAILQHGKARVGISNIEPQGNYAIKIFFDDGHDSGIYTWQYLHDLGKNKETIWSDYLDQLNKAGKGRDPDESVIKFQN